MSGSAQPLSVPVTGGELRGGVWSATGGAERVAVAIHGITLNHLVWAKVGRNLAGGDPPVALVAPDLRGRVLSAGLPGPFGVRPHVADVVAVLDAFAIDRAVVVGHSLGASIAAVLAATAPERVAGLVLVDGGVPPTPSPGPTLTLEERLGSVIARLRSTYPNRAAYLAEWAAHPAFKGGLDDDTRAAVTADLAGSGFAWRSTINDAAVEADARDVMSDGEIQQALLRSECPAIVLRAARSPLDLPEPSITPAAVDGLLAARPNTTVVDIPDTNHSTIVLGQAGADAVAGAIRSLS